MIDISFQLKGSAITVVILALVRYEPHRLAQELSEKINQAPQFFHNSPILISLDKLENNGDCEPLQEDCLPLLQICRELGLQPLGFMGVPEAYKAAVKKTGLAVITHASERELKLPAEVNVQTRIEERLVHRSSRVVTRPVRSGQQIYAEGADLIVLAQVSEGAEVLADGHIHVYGALRGRALAGVRGDESARIFCQSMEAELVSVAGNFLLRDAFPSDVLKKSAQIYLEGENLCLERLVTTATQPI